MALDEATREALALRRLAMELGISGAEVIPIMEDNQTVVNVATGVPPGERLKHVHIRYFAVQADQRAGRLG